MNQNLINSLMKLLKVFGLIVVYSELSRAQTVCTMTINSDNEKKVFQKHLGNQGFQFIELTDYASNSDVKSDDWLLNACKAKVECDILLVSAHFGLSFFGSSGYSTKLSDLEELSCSSTCDGILKKPKQVYLMGCNTLAGKEADFRSPEAYQTALVEHGVDRFEAQQIVSARYGPTGFATHDKVTRIFENVPLIFGFNSIAPTGSQVEKSLDQYLKGKNVKTFFDTSEKAKNDQIKQFKQWLAGFHVTHSKGIIAGSANAVIKQNICQILGRGPIENRLKILFDKMIDNPVVYVTTAAQLIQKEYTPILHSQISQHREKIQQLRSIFTLNPSTKQQLLQIVESRINPATDFSVLQFLLSVGWIDIVEYNERLEQSIINSAIQGTVVAADQVCSLVEESYYVRQEITTPQLNQLIGHGKIPPMPRMYSCLSQIKDVQRSPHFKNNLFQLVQKLSIKKLSDMELVQLISIFNKIHLGKIEKDQLLARIIAESQYVKQDFIKPYLNSIQLLDMNDSDFNLLINRLKLDFNIIEYEVYWNVFKKLDPKSARFHQLMDTKIEQCLLKNEYCQLQSEIQSGNDLWVDQLLIRVLERNNSVLLNHVLQEIQYLKNFRVRSKLNIDLIVEQMKIANTDLEVFHFSSLLRDQNINLSQLLKLQKIYLDLERPDLYGYYLAQILQKNRLILPFLVDLKEFYFVRQFERSRMNGAELLYYDKKSLTGQ